jgi:hypothetical protein
MYQARRDFPKICTRCGEIFDASVEAYAAHHENAEHAPLMPPHLEWPKPRQAITALHNY